LPDSFFFRMENQTVKIMADGKGDDDGQVQPLNTVPFIPPATDAAASAFVATATLLVIRS